MKIDCVKCHGKYYAQHMTCGHSFCPIYTKLPQMKTLRLEKENFVGTAPSVFVGRYGYPNINLGILAPPDTVEKEGELYDAPKEWSKRGFRIQDILDFRSVLINSRTKASVKTAHKYLEISQEVALASKPVDVEFFLQKKPTYQINMSNVETVLGAYAELKKAVLTSNPHVDLRVEKVVDDSDLKSVDALNILYKKGFNETFLARILSVGSLGVKAQRRLVPTRFSITAVDDQVGKGLIEEIKDYSQGDYMIYFGGYLGNYYLVIFFPGIWGYELFEIYIPSTLLNPEREIKFSTDYEFYGGRKTYAEQCVGGYYASRLAILEKLKELKRQQTVLVLRFITDEYSTPLGVFVCREATRISLKNEALKFNSKESLLFYVKDFIYKRFKFDINKLLQKSVLLQQINQQKKLFDFM